MLTVSTATIDKQEYLRDNLLNMHRQINPHLNYLTEAAGPRSAVGSASDSRARGPRFDTWSGRIHTFVSPSTDSRRAVVSSWRKYAHKVLVNCLGGLSLPRKSVVRLTDSPDMTLVVYHGSKTLTQQQPH